jgi:hypothetical protein
MGKLQDGEGAEQPPPASGKPHLSRSTSQRPRVAMINPETIFSSALTTAACFVAWIVAQAWASGAIQSGSEFQAYILQRLELPGWGSSTDAGEQATQSFLTEFVSLINLSSTVNLLFGFVLILQAEHFARNLFVGGLWACDNLGLTYLVELFKMLLLFFPRTSNRRYHEDENVGLIFSSSTESAIHSLEGFDSFALQAVHFSVCVLFSIKHALKFHDETIDNLLYAMMICRFIIPLHAATSRLFNDAITEAMVERLEGAKTFKQFGSYTLKVRSWGNSAAPISSIPI